MREARRFWPGQRRPLPSDRARDRTRESGIWFDAATSRLVNRHALHTAAPLTGAATPGVIDQDPAHDLRRDAKEVRPILPIDLSLIDEPQVDLIYQRRRLQGVVGPLAAKLAHRNPTQLRIDKWSN